VSLDGLRAPTERAARPPRGRRAPTEASTCSTAQRERHRSGCAPSGEGGLVARNGGGGVKKRGFYGIQEITFLIQSPRGSFLT
jgi:hypothetical protein